MRLRRKPLLVLLVKRAVLFLTIMGGVTIFLYGVGTSQNFLEATQLGLLRLASLFGLLSAVGSLYGLALDLFFAYRLKARRFIAGAFAYALSAVFGVLVAAFSNGVLVAVAGNLS